ncbi:hypothetical protein Q4E93_15765 [Flavitalea sp. BT771]|uniref:hypothetical protein n=1 Tax=Flavitalea sp. BT771 TaxID=3063329 RepID=UPI0026E218F5|nr:hypothetical protein [Flavitalea sp. BT771]MDO6432059.1 hypothetical protein [Flavitalea sp. BT771]MDV6220968.1 hypothetical protein [Flavitalea sp. BT771]
MSQEQSMGGDFSGALLTGVFAGFAGTIICLVFNIIYRDDTGFLPSAIINVSSLIFAVNILFVFIGLAYFLCVRYLPKGDIAFEVIFLLLTLVCLLGTSGVHRSDDAVVNHQFKGLLMGVIIILGICCAAMPVMFRNKRFREHVI